MMISGGRAGAPGARGAGLGLAVHPACGAAEVCGVKAGPQGRRVSDAQQPWGRRGGPVPCAALREVSGGAAATTPWRFHAAFSRCRAASKATGEIIPMAECRRVVLY